MSRAAPAPVVFLVDVDNTLLGRCAHPGRLGALDEHQVFMPTNALIRRYRRLRDR